MNTQELLAVANLINACETFNRFTQDSVDAAKREVPLLLSEKREYELRLATVSVRVALERLQPRILEAIKRTEEEAKRLPVDDEKSV